MLNSLNVSDNDTKNLTENCMTVKEISTAIGVSVKTVQRTIEKLFPGKMQNGKTTYLNEQEVACISKELKNDYHLAQLAPSQQVSRLNLTTEFEVLANYKAANDAFVKLLEAKTEELERINQENKPKVEFYNEVTGSSDTIDMKEVAKVLNCGMGRNKIFEMLRDKKILDNHNQPYQKYVDNGYFRVVESKYVTNDGEVKISLKTVVYQKGLDFIRRQIKGLSDTEIQDYRNKLANPEYMENAINEIATREAIKIGKAE